MLKQAKNVFFIGVKGVAMANLAVFLKRIEKNVNGCDVEEEFITDKLLKKNKINWQVGFQIKTLPKKTDLVVYSAAHGGTNNPIVQEAKKRKLSIPQSEIDAEMKKIEVNVSSQGSTLDALLAQQGMTKDDLVGEIKLQLLVTKMVDDNISVTDKEADDYIASQKSQLSLDSTQPAPELTRDQAKTAIKQQKLQTKIQTFVADLKAKAKINYFVKY